MRKILLALSAVAVAVLGASVGTKTEAAPLGNPNALAGAVDEVAVVDSVHCRPGWRHHRPHHWRRADGCVRRGVRSDIYVVPGRTRYIWRDGVRVRVGAGGGPRRGDRVRTRTDVNVNVRGGGDRRGDGVRSGGQRGGGAAQTTTGGGTRQGGTGGAAQPKGSTGGGAAQPSGQGGGGSSPMGTDQKK